MSGVEASELAAFSVQVEFARHAYDVCPSGTMPARGLVAADYAMSDVRRVYDEAFAAARRLKVAA